jgi:hypothetical protein
LFFADYFVPSCPTFFISTLKKPTITAGGIIVMVSVFCLWSFCPGRVHPSARIEKTLQRGRNLTLNDVDFSAIMIDYDPAGFFIFTGDKIFVSIMRER